MTKERLNLEKIKLAREIDKLKEDGECFAKSADFYDSQIKMASDKLDAFEPDSEEFKKQIEILRGLVHRGEIELQVSDKLEKEYARLKCRFKKLFPRRRLKV